MPNGLFVFIVISIVVEIILFLIIRKYRPILDKEDEEKRLKKWEEERAFERLKREEGLNLDEKRLREAARIEAEKNRLRREEEARIREENLRNTPMKSLTPIGFEEFTAQYLQDHGYQNVHMTSTTGDYGADIIAKTPNGQRICVQCKLYSKPVGISAVQEVFAAKSHYRCAIAAVAVNDNGFTKGAINLARENKVLLYKFNSATRKFDYIREGGSLELPVRNNSSDKSSSSSTSNVNTSIYPLPNIHHKAITIYSNAVYYLTPYGTVNSIDLYGNKKQNVFGWTNIIEICAGGFHIIGLKTDGTVVATGDNEYGQCNVSDWKNIISVSANIFHTVGLKNDGTVIAVGDNENGICNVSSWKDIICVAAGEYQTFGVKKDGSVECVGDPDYSCGVSEWKNIKSIFASAIHVFGLKYDGTVISGGDSFFGECETHNWNNIVQIASSDFHTAGLKADGSVAIVGDEGRRSVGIDNWRDIAQIAAAQFLTVGLKKDGTIVFSEPIPREESNIVFFSTGETLDDLLEK